MGLLNYFKNIIKHSIISKTYNEYYGKIGEEEVNNVLNPIWFGKVYHKYFNNYTFYDKYKNTHQIDFIEIRSNGIFVIEVKNWRGLIVGNINSNKWIQYSYGEKNYLYNGYKQNMKHCYYISKILNDKYKVNSLIVFCGNNEVKIESNNIIYSHQLKKYLKNYNDGTNYTNEEIDIIYNKLLNKYSKISNKEHLQNIKKYK